MLENALKLQLGYLSFLFCPSNSWKSKDIQFDNLEDKLNQQIFSIRALNHSIFVISALKIAVKWIHYWNSHQLTLCWLTNQLIDCR